MVEFTADGRVIQQSVGVDSPVLNGTYQWVDKETIETEITVPTGAKITDVHGLPMGQAGLMDFDFIPVGPLAPLGLLIAEK
jgi:hypothetical protein